MTEPRAYQVVNLPHSMMLEQKKEQRWNVGSS